MKLATDPPIFLSMKFETALPGTWKIETSTELPDGPIALIEPEPLILCCNAKPPGCGHCYYCVKARDAFARKLWSTWWMRQELRRALREGRL